jgi:tRNA (cmo5U34)-methyltransferase
MNEADSVHGKSSVDEIRKRFDADVERFSSLDAGQAAAMDSPLMTQLIVDAAARVCPNARSVLDIGCGAGNYTIRLLGNLPKLDATLIDLSRPMLDRAEQRVREAGASAVSTWQGDVREYPFVDTSFDIVLAASVLHHLRSEAEWRAVFASIYRSLRPGGSIWIYDLVSHQPAAVHDLMWQRYADYLIARGGPEYRDKVFDYVEREDTPRSVTWQLELLRQIGFAHTEILHKNGPFAAFGAIR